METVVITLTFDPEKITTAEILRDLANSLETCKVEREDYSYTIQYHGKS